MTANGSIPYLSKDDMLYCNLSFGLLSAECEGGKYLCVGIAVSFTGCISPCL